MNGEERRALHALLRYREPGVTPYRRITPAMRADLLGWAATLSDEELLDMRGVGPVMVRVIRERQLMPEGTPPTGLDTFALVLQRCGWRVEVFWNESGGWFTARLTSLYDRDGKRTYPGGFLVPFEDPIGASGATPEEAVANLSEAVLEWA